MSDQFLTSADREHFEVELYSTDPQAVQATFDAIRQLGGFLYVTQDGKFIVDTFKPDFVKWAIVQQGYVRRVVE